MALAFRYPEPITEDFILALSRANPLHKFETTADGELVVSPPTGTRASFGEGELHRQVASWNAIHRLGYVVPPSGGITLPDSAIKAPDTAFISHGRWNALTPADRARAFTRVAPDVTFELLSPRDDFDETVAKITEYLVNGTLVGVLLNPRDRTVGVARSPKNWRISTDPDALEIGGEMPGFILNARAVFDACEGKG